MCGCSTYCNCGANAWPYGWTYPVVGAPTTFTVTGTTTAPRLHPDDIEKIAKRVVELLGAK